VWNKRGERLPVDGRKGVAGDDDDDDKMKGEKKKKKKKGESYQRKEEIVFSFSFKE
jgi:hypothetical protein